MKIPDTGPAGPSFRGVASAAVLALVLAAIVIPVRAEQRVVVFKGTGSKLTEEFEVTGPWLLDWQVTGTLSQNLGVEITLLEGEFLRHGGIVLNQFRAGSGTKLFNDRGRYRFRVNSSFADWRLAVSQITREEAARMVPLR